MSEDFLQLLQGNSKLHMYIPEYLLAEHYRHGYICYFGLTLRFPL